MKHVAIAFFFVAALVLGACSSSGKGGASDADAGGSTTLYGLCSVGGGATGADLGMSADGVYGYTLPLPAGQTQDITLTVLNRGPLPATQMLDVTAQSSVLSYKGGAYPGTGGTCGTDLGPGATCTLSVTVVAPPTGRQTSMVILQYYDGFVFTTDTHLVIAVATTGAFTPAPHAPLAQMPQNGGQAPLANVHFVTVSFSDTPADGDIQTFGDWLVTSDWWATVGADYGVGAGTHEHVVLPDATPASVIDAEFAAYVDARIAGGALPKAPQSVYAFFLSGATTVTDVVGAGGWHNLSPGGNDYAVILPGCAADPTDIFESYTFVAAHELIESATDPAPLGGYDFGFGEGEVADLCNDPIEDNGYVLPTIWSNTAAAKGGDPCVPATGAPYVDVDSMPGTVTIAPAAGATATVTLTGWSTVSVGDWLLQASVVGKYGGSFTATLDPNATDLINNGQLVQLIVTTDGSAPAGASALVEIMTYAPLGDSGVTGVQLIPVTVSGG
jgi:hypothetical protein